MEDCWNAFDLAACGWLLKQLPDDDLPDAATAALSGGCETPALVRLAVMDGASWSEFPSAVTAVFAERGLPMPSREEATKSLADDLLKRMVAGAIDARLGCKQLYHLAIAASDQPGYADLDVFIGFDHSFGMADQGLYNTPDQVHDAVLECAGDLLARGGVRAS